MQTIIHANPNAHRLASGTYTSVSYQADLNRFKEDLDNAIKKKLGGGYG